MTKASRAWVIWLLWTGHVAAQDGDSVARAFFESRIRPVLVRECYECHSHATDDPKAGLRLDWRDGLRRGGESGPALVPGRPRDSLLLEALRHTSLQMPPEKKLPDGTIADFERWIADGAFDPRDRPPDARAAADAAWSALFDERSRWWSLLPPARAALPDAGSEAAGDWGTQWLDRLVLRRLADAGLRPAPRADRRTLARRLSFALLGLPPEPATVRAFVEDARPGAYTRLVDRLLASPHFGERWARHWMDVVRYTDTYGYEWDIPAKGAWRYRDYLIRGWNEDVPFDQLVREQIAGDLLEAPRVNRRDGVNESLIGLMFFQMGEKRHGDSSEFNGIHQEMLDNKIDAFSKAFQGLTIACARCHDHKLDAVAQREYYALAGIFMSSRWVCNTVDRPERNAKPFSRLKALKAELRPLLAGAWRAEAAVFPDALLAAAGSGAAPAGEPGAAATKAWRTALDAARKNDRPLEDPASVWARLRDVAAARTGEDGEGAEVASAWNALARQYAETSATRKRENAARFRTVVDFREGIPAGWSVDGVGLRAVAHCGDFTVALRGETAVGQLLPGGLYTNTLSPRLNGAVRTPLLSELDGGHISFECSGGDFAAHRTVIDNAFLTEKQKYLDWSRPTWTRLSTRRSIPPRRVYIEFATKTSNPNFPPRVGLGGPCSEEQAADPRSWFGLTRVVLHDAAQTPQDELEHVLALFDSAPPTNWREAAERFAGWFDRALARWQSGGAAASDVRLINWLLAHGLLTNRHEATDAVHARVTEYRTVEAGLALPWTVNGVADTDTPLDYRLNIRGDYDELGEPVPRGYVEVLAGAEPPPLVGSGRRQLAELVASPANPLTARVFVNRVWHWLFGAGLVATPNDFGHLGQPPSHPRLLDELAIRFVEEEWSLKRLVRTMVLSETWCQSGAVSPEGRRADPDNRWLHHFPLRRLEAEAVRDALLAVSGRLDRRLHGRPIDPTRAHEDPQKRLFSGPRDGAGRRSIYTKVTIMEPPRFLATFNQPEPKIPTGRRDVTNTPAQSLTLLNDPFVIEQAEEWARAVCRRPSAGVRERIVHMFRLALGRPPTDTELRRWTMAVAELTELAEVSSGGPPGEAALWAQVAHLLFNTKEFIYVR